VTPTSHRRSSSRGAVVLAVVALLVAAAALGLAGWMWYHPRSSSSSAAHTNTQPSNSPQAQTDSAPSSNSPDAYTDQQRTDAKTKVCTAYNTVIQAVKINTNMSPPGGDTEVGSLAVAGNARVALLGGGQYLVARVDPATPPDLADTARQLGNTLMDIGAYATAGVQNSDPAQAARLQQADQANGAMVALCK
jgi:hypothetical protein